jgi:hypothetical protein
MSLKILQGLPIAAQRRAARRKRQAIGSWLQMWPDAKQRASFNIPRFVFPSVLLGLWQEPCG